MVIAQGRDSYSEDGEAESEWVGHMVLFDKDKKIIEKVKLTSCPDEE